MEQIYGLSKKERDELKKLLLKDTVASKIKGQGQGLVLKTTKVKLPTMKNPDTGNDIKNLIAQLSIAPKPEEDADEGEEKDNDEDGENSD